MFFRSIPIGLGGPGNGNGSDRRSPDFLAGKVCEERITIGEELRRNHAHKNAVPNPGSFLVACHVVHTWEHVWTESPLERKALASQTVFVIVLTARRDAVQRTPRVRLATHRSARMSDPSTQASE